MKISLLWIYITLFVLSTTSCQKETTTPDRTSAIAGTYILSRLLVGPTSLGASGNATITAVNKVTANVKVSIKSSSGPIEFNTDYQVRQDGDKFLLLDGASQATIGTVEANLLSLQITSGTLKYTGEFSK